MLNEDATKFKHRKRSRVRVACLAFVVMIALILLVPILRSEIFIYVGVHDRFNSTEWKAADHEERDRMLSDLLRKYLLVGMDKIEIETLLGRPSAAYPDPPFPNDSIGLTKIPDDGDIDYELGIQRHPLFGPEQTHLRLVLVDGKVARYYLYD
jgi:hypothetical protein